MLNLEVLMKEIISIIIVWMVQVYAGKLVVGGVKM